MYIVFPDTFFIASRIFGANFDLMPQAMLVEHVQKLEMLRTILFSYCFGRCLATPKTGFYRR